MTILARFYTSGGKEVAIDTLEIDLGDSIFYFVRGWDDIEATTEGGDVRSFVACGMDVALPAKTADGFQDLTFAISNITGAVSTAILKALADKVAMSVTYRRYISSDLAAPAAKPYKMKFKSGQWTAVQGQVTAGYMNILDTAWPRHRYTLNKHPGLRYF